MLAKINFKIYLFTVLGCKLVAVDDIPAVVVSQVEDAIRVAHYSLLKRNDKG